MEILCLTHKYPPSVGGMEKQSFKLVEGLRKYGQVHLLACTNESKPVFFFNLRRRVKKILQDHPRIGLIHCNDAVMAAFSLWLKDFTDIPVTATFHGLDVVFPNRFYQKVIFPRFQRVDHIVCVSRYTANECIRRGLDEKMISVIHNGIDHLIAKDVPEKPENVMLKRLLDRKRSENVKILISVGRAVRRKGFVWFIHNVLPDLPSNYLFVVAGPLETGSTAAFWDWLIPKKWARQYELFWGKASDSAEIRRLNKTGAKSRFIHLGKLSDSDLNFLYDLADVFVMPNIPVSGDAEGFGLVALEACLHGTPVAASRVDGIVDAVIHERNGWLVEPENSRSWTSAVRLLCEDSSIAKRLTQEGPEFTKKTYGWGRMSKAYFNLFESIVKPASSKTPV